MLLTGILLTTVLIASFSQKSSDLPVSFKVNGSTPPLIVRDKTISGGFGDDKLRGGISTQDGGYLFSGTSPGEDYWIVKTDAQYNKLWDRTFGGNNNETLWRGIPAPGEGYLLLGYSDSGISGEKSEGSKGGFDYWVIKVDGQGNKVWDKTFGGVHNDVLLTAVSTSDGGYLLGGFSESDASGDKSENSKGDRDYWVVRIDSQGNKIWDKSFGGGASDELRSIVATDGGWLLFGNSESNISGDKSVNSKGSNDYWIIKIDYQGNKVWDKTIGGSAYDYLLSAIPTLDGDYLLTGYSNSNAFRRQN